MNASNGEVSVVAAGGTTPYYYTWSPTGGTAASATGLAAGTYMVNVTDSNSCQKTETITITEPGMCFTRVGVCRTKKEGGGDGDGDEMDKEWKECARESLTSFKITTTGELTGSITQTNVPCYGGNGSATVLASGGTSPYNYAWSPHGGSAKTAKNLSAGSYTVVITDALLATVSYDVEILQPSMRDE